MRARRCAGRLRVPQDKESRDPQGPLNEWPEGEVKEALANYAKGRPNAKTLMRWVLSAEGLRPVGPQLRARAHAL
eukprot:7007257-Alexandrium_andersonii.AAC.1